MQVETLGFPFLDVIRGENTPAVVCASVYMCVGAGSHP